MNESNVCGIGIRHEFCNFKYTIIERDWNRADADAWKRSKNGPYKRKMAGQQNKMEAVPEVKFKKK